METMYQKATQSVRRYLELRGCEILEEGWCHGKDSIDFIAHDENDDLVFIKCTTHGNEGEGIPEENPDRKAFERIAAAYLTESDCDNTTVRFDLVSLLVIGDSRTLLRHHINALSTMG